MDSGVWAYDVPINSRNEIAQDMNTVLLSTRMHPRTVQSVLEMLVHASMFPTPYRDFILGIFALLRAIQQGTSPTRSIGFQPVQVTFNRVTLKALIVLGHPLLIDGQLQNMLATSQKIELFNDQLIES